MYADKDYVLYQELLGDRENVTFRLYEDLNHLFMTSTSGTLEEYEIKSNIDTQVLEDLVLWIQSFAGKW